MRYNVIAWDYNHGLQEDCWVSSLEEAIEHLKKIKEEATAARGVVLDFAPMIPQMMLELHHGQIINSRQPHLQIT